jgi:peptidoglycan hydrolase-like protein with peptidoglycan-binding domain
MHKINSSVGLGGTNRKNDVFFIQQLLNDYQVSGHKTLLEVDGVSGSRTIAQIKAFQKNILKMSHPDGRIDPEGKTLFYLSKRPIIASQPALPSTIISPPAPSAPNTLNTNALKPPVTPAAPTKVNPTITMQTQVSYGAGVEQIVSDHSKSIIRLALQMAGMPHAVMTSTIRTPNEQAKIMYKNAKINLAGQYKLYGSAGDKVLKVYEKNKEKPQDEVLRLMVAKIVELGKSNIRVSKHVVTREKYKQRNIIDIGVNSTKAKCGAKFNAAAFTKALEQLKTEGRISKFIDETKKSNTCWHIEISQ